jgi:HD-like signal output (HDOD) protein/CheY-like chemotaxis protein
MRRILFVDAERRACDALAAYVGADGVDWLIDYEANSTDALDRHKRDPYDVVVSELTTGSIDGMALLHHVRELTPSTVRIMLSSAANVESRLRAVPVAHQYLTKPSNPIDIRNVILRSCNLQELLHSDAVRGMVGGLSSLPSVPRLFNELQMKLDNPDTSAQDIASIIERDPAMTAKVLQIVNSAYFGLSRQLGSVRDAVAYLGFGQIRNLVLAIGVFRSFSDYGRGLSLWIESLQTHCLLTARVASKMFSDRRRADDAFMAAVLHDTGKLVLATQKPQYLREVMAMMKTRGLPMHVVERELSGVTHAEIGGYLMGLWGLPYPVVEAVTCHHSPVRMQDPRFDMVAAVHIADMLANEQTRGNAPVSDEQDTLDLAYVESIGVLDQLSTWRAYAEQEAGNRLAMA